MSEIIFKNTIFQTKAKLIKNIAVTPKHYKILLSCSRIAKVAKPGQFLNVRVKNSDEPLLRRPFSIHRVKGANLEILYEVLGQATEILSQRKTGEYLDIIGPLGNGFNYQLPCLAGRHLPILVGGGMGVAPLIFLSEKLAELKTQNSKVLPCRQAGKTQVLIGAKTKTQILCEKEFKDSGCQVKIATDDGSKGFKGKITDLLAHLLATNDQRPATIYACGPRPMFKEISRISQKYNIPSQFSLEEHMACGIGACLGCVVKTRDGFKRVCKEGPVFNADEII